MSDGTNDVTRGAALTGALLLAVALYDLTARDFVSGAWLAAAIALLFAGMRLTDKATLVDDMKEALATPGPVVCDVRVTREENTYPMIAPGQAAREMVG